MSSAAVTRSKDEALAVQTSRQFLSPDVGYSYHHGHHHHQGGGQGCGGQTNLERVPSMTRLQPQSSTETSGLGETITSGFSSQESVHSAANYSYSPTRYSPGKASPVHTHSPEVVASRGSNPSRGGGRKYEETGESSISKTIAELAQEKKSSSYKPAKTSVRYDVSETPADPNPSKRITSGNPDSIGKRFSSNPSQSIAKRNPHDNPTHHGNNPLDTAANYGSSGIPTRVPIRESSRARITDSEVPVRDSSGTRLRDRSGVSVQDSSGAFIRDSSGALIRDTCDARMRDSEAFNRDSSGALVQESGAPIRDSSRALIRDAGGEFVRDSSAALIRDSGALMRDSSGALIRDPNLDECRSLSPEEARALFASTRSRSNPAARDQHSASIAKHSRERVPSDGGERRGGGSTPSRDSNGSRQAAKSSTGVTLAGVGVREIIDTQEKRDTSRKGEDRHARVLEKSGGEKRNKRLARTVSGEREESERARGSNTVYVETEPSRRRGDIDRKVTRHATSDSERGSWSNKRQQEGDVAPGKSNIYTPERCQPTSALERARKDSSGGDRREKNYAERQLSADKHSEADRKHSKEHAVYPETKTVRERGRQRTFDETSERPKVQARTLVGAEGGSDISQTETLVEESVREGRPARPRKERDSYIRYGPEQEDAPDRLHDSLRSERDSRDEVSDRRLAYRTRTLSERDPEYTVSKTHPGRNVAARESLDNGRVDRTLEKQRSRDSGIERTLERQKTRDVSARRSSLERQVAFDGADRERAIERQQSRDKRGRQRSLDSQGSVSLDRHHTSHRGHRSERSLSRQLSREVSRDSPDVRDFPGSPPNSRKTLEGQRDKVSLGHRVDSQQRYSGDAEQKQINPAKGGIDTEQSLDFEKTRQRISSEQEAASVEEPSRIRRRHLPSDYTTETSSSVDQPASRKPRAKPERDISVTYPENEDGRRAQESRETLRGERKTSSVINNAHQAHKGRVASPPAGKRAVKGLVDREGKSVQPACTPDRPEAYRETARLTAGTALAADSRHDTQYGPGAEEKAQQLDRITQPYQRTDDNQEQVRESGPTAKRRGRELPVITQARKSGIEVLSNFASAKAEKAASVLLEVTRRSDKGGVGREEKTRDSSRRRQSEERGGSSFDDHREAQAEREVKTYAEHRGHTSADLDRRRRHLPATEVDRRRDYHRELPETELDRKHRHLPATDLDRRRDDRKDPQAARREKREEIELQTRLDGKGSVHTPATLSSSTKPTTTKAMGSDGRKPLRQPPPPVTVTSPTSPESQFRPHPNGDVTSRRRNPDRAPLQHHRYPADDDVFDNLFSQANSGRGVGQGGGVPAASQPNPPGLQVDQINQNWERRGSRGSIRSRSSHGGSFRSRSGSTRRKRGRFLGISTESAWTRWSRERRASFRRRIELLEKPEEPNQRVSTPIRKARQEGLKFVHPDLEGTFLSEEDLNELRRHKQQKYHAIRVIEKTNRKGKYGRVKHEVHLTPEQWRIIGDFWEHPAFVRGRYLGLFLMLVTFIIMIVSITNGSWITYEAWNLTIWEGLWMNCTTPILVPGEEGCKATQGRGFSDGIWATCYQNLSDPEAAAKCPEERPHWQNAVIGLMIFAASFGILASVLSICGVCTSPLPRKIYYFHSAGEIFLICALSTGVALMVYPIAIELDKNISSHRYGIGYGLGWGGAFFFLAAAVCMSLDDLVREASRAKCCKWCWKSKQNDRTELRQV